MTSALLLPPSPFVPTTTANPTHPCTHSHGVFVFPLLLPRSQEGNLIDEATKGKVDAFLEAFVHAIKVSKAGEAALKASA